VSDIEQTVTPEDYELFNKIAKDIKVNPAKYTEAGKWLDEYCSEDAYWLRQETKLKELQQKKNEFPVLTNIRNVELQEQKIKERQLPTLYKRFKEAQNYFLEKHKDQQFIPEDDGKCFILITWILTDPDAEKTNLDITELDKWLWEPINDITKMSRGTAQSLWVYSRDGYERWMKLVRVTWEKLKFEKEKWYQTNTLKFVLIPIACTLILAIPAWFVLFRDGQSKTTSNSSKKTEEKPAEIKNEVPLPTLSLSSKEIKQTGSVYVALLEFQSSINQPLGKITFEAKLVNGSGAKIIHFSPVGISMDVSKKISSDCKETQLTYTIIGGYPKLKLETSDTCKILLSGSHITKAIIVEIE